VAIVASLKFLFLYLAGRALGRPMLGLCFVLGAAWPSIAAFQWLVFFHPNWVEAAVAGSFLLAALAWKRRSLLLVHASALALGLAVQMHPTALFYFPGAVVILHALGLRGVRWAAHVLLCAAAVALWFIPLLFAPHEAAGDWGQGLSRVIDDLRRFDPGEVLTVLHTAYVAIPMAVGAAYAARIGVPLPLWTMFLVFTAVAIVAGWILALRGERGGRHLVGALLVALAAGWILAAALRSYTSFYLAYFLLPLSAVTLGVGLHAGLASQQRAVRAGVYATLVLLSAAFVAAGGGARAIGSDAFIEARFPLLGDLKHPLDGRVRATLMTVAARDEFAAALCRAGRKDVTLHGDLAFELAASTGLDLAMHCPAAGIAPNILGIAPPGLTDHWTALPEGIAQRLGKRGVAVYAGVAVFNVLHVAHPAAGRKIESDWYHFEHLRDRAPLQTITLDVPARNDAILAIHRLKPFDSRWELRRVSCGALAAAPVHTTHNAAFYGGCATLWQVSFATDAPQWVDIHTF
jgi:hypothetical protein